MTPAERRYAAAAHLYALDALTESAGHPGRDMTSEKMREWAEGEHDGDCTKQCHTCDRCLAEMFLRVVDRLIEQDESARDVLDQHLPGFL